MTIGEEEFFFEKQLKGLIIDIFNENNHLLKPKAEHCSFCDFKAICGR